MTADATNAPQEPGEREPERTCRYCGTTEWPLMGSVHDDLRQCEDSCIRSCRDRCASALAEQAEMVVRAHYGIERLVAYVADLKSDNAALREFRDGAVNWIEEYHKKSHEENDCTGISSCPIYRFLDSWDRALIATKPGSAPVKEE